MIDIITFNKFIAQDVLIVFYYIGAVVVPVGLWFAKDYLTRKFPYLKRLFTHKQNFYVILAYIAIFFFMELFFRMIFEAMIGYFDMHDYLYEISKNLKRV